MHLHNVYIKIAGQTYIHTYVVKKTLCTCEMPRPNDDKNINGLLVLPNPLNKRLNMFSLIFEADSGFCLV